MAGLERLEIDGEALALLCAEHGVAELAAFGSVLRNDFSDRSDVDLLVEFQEGRTPSLFDLVRLQHRLEDLIGRKVDLVPRDGLKPRVRDAVLSSARVIHGMAGRGFGDALGR
jgi:predicted nucleotidyltransferase